MSRSTTTKTSSHYDEDDNDDVHHNATVSAAGYPILTYIEENVTGICNEREFVLTKTFTQSFYIEATSTLHITNSSAHLIRGMFTLATTKLKYPRSAEHPQPTAARRRQETAPGETFE